MKNTMRKLLAYMLSFLMLISCMPTEALAEIIVETSQGTQPFMTAAILPGTEPVVTYTFDAGDAENWTKPEDQIVRPGEVVLEPDAPAKDGYKFMGWYTQKNGAGQKMDFTQPVTDAKSGVVTLYACFKEVHYVFFMDAAKGTENIRVFKTKEGVAGESVTTTDVNLPVNVTQRVAGWLDANGTTVGANYRFGDADAYLYPDIQDGHWITFVAEDDATYTEPQFVPYGSRSEKVDSPTRLGYEFAGWYNGNSPYTLGSWFYEPYGLQSNLTLTAHWTRKRVNYTVNYWKENADWNNTFISASQRPPVQYSFIGSRTMQGLTGSQTSNNLSQKPNNMQWGDSEVSAGFNAGTFTRQTIKGDGSTIVDVYFTRKTFTLKFYSDNGEKQYDDLTIQAKYNAQINSKWPTNPNDNSTAWDLNKWKSGIYTYTSSVQRMPAENKSYYSRPQRNYKVTFNYHLETLTANKFATPSVAAGTLKVGTYNSTSSTVTKEEILDFVGFSFRQSGSTKKGEKLNENGGVKNFYYTRNPYTIKYMNLKDNASTEKTFKYEANISSGYWEPTDAQTPLTPEGDKKTFAGWYADENLTTPFKFTGNMPAYNFIVYAKWKDPEVKATVHVHALTDHTHDHSSNGEHTTDPKKLKYGMSLEEAGYDNNSWLFSPDAVYEAAGIPPEERKNNYTWYGWVKEDGTPFNFNEQIFEDLNIYPSYAATGPFELKYDGNDATGGVAPTDTLRYRGDSAADVAGPNTLTKEDSVFLGWSTDPNASKNSENLIQPGDKFVMKQDSTLYAIWGPKPRKTTITYHTNYPAASDLAGYVGEKSYEIPNNGKHTVLGFSAALEGANKGTPTGYTFQGWSKNPDAEVAEYKAGTDIRVNKEQEEKENHLYAVWERDTGTLVVQKVLDESDGLTDADSSKQFEIMTAQKTSEAGQSMAGVEFTSKTAQLTGGQSEMYTDVPTGEYTVSETPNEEYVTTIEPAEVVVKAGETAYVTVHNRKASTTLEKVAMPDSNLALGELVKYTLTIHNGSGAVVRDALVTDDNFTRIVEDDPAHPITYNPADAVEKKENGWLISTIADGQQVTITYYLRVTPEDIATPDGTIVNNAHVSTGGDADVIVHTVDEDPGIKLDKFIVAIDTTAEDGSPVTLRNGGLVGYQAKLNDVIHYGFTVENTGNVNLNNVTITDEKIGLDETNVVVTQLVPGASVTVPEDVEDTFYEKFTYTVVQADIDHVEKDDKGTILSQGLVKNVATATGTPDKGEPPTDDGEAKQPTDIKPEIAVTKTSDGHAPYNSTDNKTITYTITLKNTGKVTLHGLYIEDTIANDLGTESLTVDSMTYRGTELELDGGKYLLPDEIELAPGDSIDVMATYTVDEQDIIAGHVKNTAIGHGFSPKDEEVKAEDDADDPTVPINGNVTITKGITNQDILKVDDTAEFEIVVTNEGNVTVSNFVVNENITYNGIELSGMTFNRGKVDPEGTQVTFSGDTATIGTLAPGATVKLYVMHTVTEQDVINGFIFNAVTGSGETPTPGPENSNDPDPTPTPSAKIKVTPEPPEAKIVLTKQAGVINANGLWEFKDEGFKAGDVVTYQITVRSDSNVTLPGVWVADTDTHLEDIKFVNFDYTADDAEDVTIDDNPKYVYIKGLRPHGVVTLYATHTITQRNVLDGVVNNRVDDGGNTPVPLQPSPAPDVPQDPTPTPIKVETPSPTDEQVYPTPPNPAIEITKTSDVTPGTRVPAGNVITYTMVVRNVGDIDLTDVVVNDDLEGLTVTAAYWNDDEDDDTGIAFTPQQVTIDSLPVGENVVTIKATYTVTEADMVLGYVYNYVEAEASPIPMPKDPKNPTETTPPPVTPHDEDDHMDYPEYPEPELDVLKGAVNVPADGYYKEGDTVVYVVAVKNIGNITLNDVTFTDKMLMDGSASFVQGGMTGYDIDAVLDELGVEDAGSKLADSASGTTAKVNSLAPGQIAYAFAEHKVSLQDVINGVMYNSAAIGDYATPSPAPERTPVETTTPSPTPVPDPTPTPTSTAVVSANPSPAFTILKEDVELQGNAWMPMDDEKRYELGEVVNYRFTVTNTGNIPLYDVTVTDEMMDEAEGLTIAADPNTTDPKYTVNGETVVIKEMAAGAVVYIYATHTITEDDVLRGYVHNVITGSGTGPTPNPTPGPDGNTPGPNDPSPTPIPVTPPPDSHETVTPASPSPELTLRKDTIGKHAEPYVLGEKIEYLIVATNTGNVTLTNVVVEDPLTGDVFTAADWTVDPPLGFNSNVHKHNWASPSADGKTFEGASSEYGNVEYTDTTPGTLEPGESVAFHSTAHTVSEADILRGYVYNVVTGSGTEPDGDPVPGKPDDELDLTVKAESTLTMTKEIDYIPVGGPGHRFAEGETVDFIITITNTGTVSRENVVITDEMAMAANAAGVTFVQPPETATVRYAYEVSADGKEARLTSPLAPNTTAYLYAKYTLTQQDIVNQSLDNIVYGSGSTPTPPPEVTPVPELSPSDPPPTPTPTPENTPTPEPTPTASIPVPEVEPDPQFSILKEALGVANGDGTYTRKDEGDGEGYEWGDTITYSITVTNTGNVDLFNVTIDDGLVGATVIPSLDDPNAYTIDANNNAVIPMLTRAGSTDEPNQVVVYAQYTVVDQDILNGSVHNVATGSGTGPNPSPTPGPDGNTPGPNEPTPTPIPVPSPTPSEEEVDTEDPDPDYELIKTVTNLPERGYFIEGETALFNIEIENTGNVPITSFVLTDTLANCTILPGENYTVLDGNRARIDVPIPARTSFNVQASYTITEGDAMRGSVINIVTGSGRWENGPLDPKSAQVTVPTLNVFFNVTVYYYYTGGGVAAPTQRREHLRAGTYYNFVSPTIDGYTVSRGVVEGYMPMRDLEFVVYYTPVPAPGGAPGGGGPGGGGGLVTIDDLGVPLNIGNVTMNVGDCFE